MIWMATKPMDHEIYTWHGWSNTPGDAVWGRTLLWNRRGSNHYYVFTVLG